MKKIILCVLILIFTNPILSKEPAKKIVEKKELGKESSEKEIIDDSLRMNSFESAVRRKASLVRIGFGASSMINIYNSQLNSLYDGWGGFLDFYYYRIRSRKGNGMDFFIRMNSKYFWSDNKRMMNNLFITENTSRIFMGGADTGVRFIYGFYFLHEFWQVYIIGAPRFLYTHVWTKQEDIQSKTDPAKTQNKKKTTKNFYSLGAVGGGGIEFTLLPHIGLFAEYNIGYVPVGKSKQNVEGHQVFCGITLRTDVK